MKIYLVGGAVRDKLLRRPIKEKDWVVVGASVEEMLNRGYRQVGKEFPVFLHPKTNEEYALARTERKIDRGYKGFSFDTSKEVTLAADLMRRDLTINAIAESEEGELIDPYHGQEDLLHYKMLRHIGPHFSEDPVRILRVGRFLARYFALGFRVAAETYALMRAMVKAGEVNALVPERVWKELERALGEPNPEQFFIVLNTCGALPILFPHLDLDSDGFLALQAAVPLTLDHQGAARIRLAALLFDLPAAKESILTLARHYRLPNVYRELAILTALHYQEIFNAKNLTANELLALIQALDLLRREARFHDFLIVLQAISQVKKSHFDAKWLMNLIAVAKSVDIQALITQGFTGEALAKKLAADRLEKIQEWLAKK